jgi:hypothetical protein
VDFATAFGIAGLTVLFSALFGVALLIPVHYRRKDSQLKRTLLDAYEKGDGTGAKSQDEFELVQRQLNAPFQHPSIPKLVRYGLPVWMLFNLIM